ncbi:MAG: ABC transporter ATP-binding protein [Candidatus Cloacimonetes bacterium]|nr:ABC transporter ATP-binding protein [Candidatus Cloacimonadota bacterium]
MIQVENLQKTYLIGDIKVHALRGINLDIKKGEFIAIMGASGSGKTTLMNLLGCLDVPSGGQYLLDNVGIHTIDEIKLAAIRNEKIGFVFQSFFLLSRTSALENVELPLLYRKDLKKSIRHKMALEALETVQMQDRLDHYPNQLSGGQQQRVAIARAIVNNPVILFADEPTGNLDTRTSLEVIAVFQQLHQKGITLILVTHEPDIATYADRVITFKDGRIKSDVLNTIKCSALDDLKKLPIDEDEGE